jgi:hypothetical protein
MDTLSAFAMGRASKGAPLRVFDWDKARRLIEERSPEAASAGLQGDWEWTGGAIWRDGAPVPKDDTYVYLASTWAIPEIDLDGDVQECWRWQSETPGWDAETYWPDVTP